MSQIGSTSATKITAGTKKTTDQLTSHSYVSLTYELATQRLAAHRLAAQSLANQRVPHVTYMTER
jgi:hypothetical protein